MPGCCPQAFKHRTGPASALLLPLLSHIVLSIHLQIKYNQQFTRPTGNAAGEYAVAPAALGTTSSNVDVYVVPTDALLTDAEVQAILQWASYGRGIVVAGAVWNINGYAGFNAAKHPANKLLVPFGIQVRSRRPKLGKIFGSLS